MNVRVPRWISSGYSQSAQTALLTPASGKQLKVYSARLINRSGGAIDLGILRLFSGGAYNWAIGAYVDATKTLTDKTSAINAGTSTTIITTTNNDGFIVSSSEKFGLVGLTVSQADGGGATYTYQYWNGTSFATLTGISLPTAYSSTGTSLLVFAAPIDWQVGGPSGGSTITGLDTSKYNILVKATTAGAVALKVSAAWFAQFIDFAPQVANNAAFSWQVTHVDLPMTFQAGEGLLPYFGGAANAANMAQAQYLIQD